ncbi:MAG TPA: hypothetical protein VFG83_16895, partial [Kofleriaceae bacterium]|nr:hypothetical protein [Kofleriaceae bacterium]
RALAAALLAFYGFLFLIVSLAPPPGWGPCFAALALIYGAGFFSLVAGYFWARWFSIGLGMSGLISAVVSMTQIGLEPVLLFYGLTHAAVAVVLWGTPMAAAFDGKREWRERFSLDENGTHRLGKAIIRAGISLPYVVMYALAPRDGATSVILAMAALGLAAIGIWGLVSTRTWSLAAILGAAAALIGSVISLQASVAPMAGGYGISLILLGLGGAALLVSATAPFLRPAIRYLRA